MPPGRAWKCCNKKCQERDSNPRIADLKSAALDHSAILTSLDTQCTEDLLSQDGDLVKKSFVKLLVNYYGEEMMPVDKIEQETFVEFCQGLLDLSYNWASWDRLDARKLIPHPTTRDAEILQKFSSIGISPEDARRVEFVTDGGANIVNALADFKWHYRLGHVLSLCEKGPFSVAYFDLVERALQSAQEAKTLLKTCDDAIRDAKSAIARQNKETGKGLHFFNWATHSHVKMLSSFVLFRQELEERLEERQYLGLSDIQGLLNDDLRALVLFLTPFDLGGDRETSPYVTLAVWPKLIDHLEIDDGELPMVTAMKNRVRSELVRMEAVALTKICKELVAFLRLMNKLTSLGCTSLKQEVSTRWNSNLIVLRSIKGKLDKINTVLQEHSRATGKPQHKRTDGISYELLYALIVFLQPFEEHITRLEGEKYPTLPSAAYCIGELLAHCNENPSDCEVVAGCREEAKYLLQTKAKLDLTQMTAAFFWPNTRNLLCLAPDDRERVRCVLNYRHIL
ncbi:Transposable element Hobo transposase [Frankliniella fusca]|uniref:Transposable element Hobo transposase n=1 Tax=Frankliniella fusca TaxID=407009 RepID=A0AAE1LII1_9NEOP|nr:Transposable element Hobo transposase [Frankliniella fusca]